MYIHDSSAQSTIKLGAPFSNAYSSIIRIGLLEKDKKVYNKETVFERKRMTN
jgi:hypothetical protein